MSVKPSNVKKWPFDHRKLNIDTLAFTLLQLTAGRVVRKRSGKCGIKQENCRDSFYEKLYFRSERSTLVYCGCFVRVQIDFTQIEAKQKKERRKGETENPIARRDFFDKKERQLLVPNPPLSCLLPILLAKTQCNTKKSRAFPFSRKLSQM